MINETLELFGLMPLSDLVAIEAAFCSQTALKPAQLIHRAAVPVVAVLCPDCRVYWNPTHRARLCGACRAARKRRDASAYHQRLKTP